MDCDLDSTLPCLGHLIFFIENDYKHNSISVDEVRYTLNYYFGIRINSFIPRLVHSSIECSDFNVVETYNHIKNCAYQGRITEPIPGDYLLTPSMNYADTLADYVALLAKFIKQVIPRPYHPRPRDHFTCCHFNEDH